MQKKVLFVTNIPSPYRVIFFNQLSKYVDLTVVFEGRRADGLVFNWNEDEICFNYVFLSAGKVNERKLNFKVFNYIKRNRYDFIFMTNYNPITELSALMKLVFRRIPYILEVDGLLDGKKDSFLKHKLKELIIKRANNCFSPNQITDSVLVSYGANKDKIIRYPFSSINENQISIKTHEYKKTMKEELGVKEKTIILFVGQLIPRKGVETLIESAKTFSTDFGFYLAGTGNDAYYKNMAGNHQNIHFLGFLNQKTLNHYYDLSDVFVFPTREDIWGLVINEAMAHGLPIITTDRCGAGLELVRDNGIIIQPDNPYMLSEAILNVVNDKSRLEKMSEASLNLIKGHTIDKMVERHVQFITTQ